MRWLGWLLVQIAFAAADWTQFRGPNGSGVSSSKDLPEHFDAQNNVVWRTALPLGHSSPVFTTDHIFVTAFEGKRLLTICLGRASGLRPHSDRECRNSRTKPGAFEPPGSTRPRPTPGT
jgi:hypothetical protein